jgi:hypothetical protein
MANVSLSNYNCKSIELWRIKKAEQEAYLQAFSFIVFKPNPEKDKWRN